jgi:hypothetical protein
MMVRQNGVIFAGTRHAVSSRVSPLLVSKLGERNTRAEKLGVVSLTVGIVLVDINSLEPGLFTGGCIDNRRCSSLAGTKRDRYS